VPESGQLIGPYRLITALGRGAMGEVWRARDERLDRYVALKILPADHAGDVERRARMLREARAAAAIRHANVVTLFDIVAHDGEDILVMELVEGRTLSDALRKDRAPPLETALRWIEGIADALVTAHAKGILHRDIKAANVMVTDGDGIKVLDFGLAKLMRDGEVVAAVSPKPSASATKIALDETMPSAPVSGDTELDSYRTHAGQLIGTPLYMAPEQIDGQPPDERTEVFSVGVLAHEILAGKPPYSATTMDELFRQIQHDDPPAIPNLPDDIQAIVGRALAKNPQQRFASMRELRDAIAAERTRRFAPPARKWPLAVALVTLLVAGGLGLWMWRANQAPPAKPGDEYVQRALDEYEVFYNDKAMSSLRAALRVAPDHARANAYVLLFGFASDADRTAALAAGKRALPSTAGTVRTLLTAAIALAERGPRAAAQAIGAATDRELAFWRAELEYRAGDYAAAGDGYRRLLADDTKRLRGRIYDHYSSVLLYFDDAAEAKRIGALYRDAFPGEADAIGVYATTLSAAGEHTAAIAAAEEALRLAEGEDTLAGLAKVLAHEASPASRARAKELYARSLERAHTARRPIRRAALALLQAIDGELDAARATVAPCLARSRGGDPAMHAASEATARERGACLFVAGILDPANAEPIARQLDALAAEASELRPAYGDPAALARLVRARVKFFGGACILAPDARPPPADLRYDDVAVDFFAAYHVPYFATWIACESAALHAARGETPQAAAALAPFATKPWVKRRQ
jgi:hypothetical protein